MKDRGEVISGTMLPEMSPQQLAGLGGGELAYVRQIRSEDVQSMFPQAPQMPPGRSLFLLMSADGSPMLLTDSKAAAEVEARGQELTAVSLH